MHVNELGYRAWHAPLKSLFSGWAVIAETGVTLAWRGSWVRRILFFAFLPAIPLAVGFFVFEFSANNPQLRMIFEQVLTYRESPFYQPEVAKELEQKGMETGNARHLVWSSLLLFFFRYSQAVAMVLVVGLIAPKLIAQDVRSRAFLLYFSRPISVIQYVLGKSAIVWFFIAWITTGPALVMYVAAVFMSPSISVVYSTYDLPLRILLASAVLIIPTTSLALCYSSLTTETRNAGFMWFATWIIGWVAFTSLATRDVAQQFVYQPPTRQFQGTVESLPEFIKEVDLPPEVLDELSRVLDERIGDDDEKKQIHQKGRINHILRMHQRSRQRERVNEIFAESQWSLFSLYHTLGRVQTWVFGLEPEFKKVLPSIILLIVVTVISMAILFRRVTAPLRV